MEARTFSWSTRDGKLNDLENSPTLRSETQIFASGFAGLSPCAVTSVVFLAESLLPSLSVLAFPSLPSVVVVDESPSSMKPDGGVPEV